MSRPSTRPLLGAEPGNNPNKINQVQNEIQATQKMLLQNIDATLERGEKITLLEDKAEKMTVQAKQFRKTATDVKRHFCAQYWKTTLLILFILAAIGLVLWLIFKPKSDSNN